MEKPGRRGKRAGTGTAGSVVVWVVLLLVPVLGFTALAVDTGAHMARAGRLQQLADEAALAGARELARVLETQDPAMLKLGTDDQYNLTSAGVQQIGQAAQSVLAGGRLTNTTNVDVNVGRWQTAANGTYRYVANQPKLSNAVRVSVADSAVQPLLGRLFGVGAFRMGGTGTAALLQTERLDANNMGMPFAVSQAWFTRQSVQKEPRLVWSVMGPNDDHQCLAINTYDQNNYVDTSSRNLHDISCLLSGGDTWGCEGLAWLNDDDYGTPQDFICNQGRITDLERIVCSYYGIGSSAFWRSPAAQTIFTDPPAGGYRRSCDGDDTIECVYTQRLDTFVDQMNAQVCRDRCGGQNCGSPCCQYEGLWEADCYSSDLWGFLGDVLESIESLSHSDAKIERAMWENFVMMALADVLSSGGDTLNASVTQCDPVEFDGRTLSGGTLAKPGKCHYTLDEKITDRDDVGHNDMVYHEARILVELVRLHGNYRESLPVYEDASSGGKCQVPDGQVPIVGFARTNIDQVSFLKVSEQSRDRDCWKKKWYGLFNCDYECEGWPDWENESKPYREFHDVQIALDETFGGTQKLNDVLGGRGREIFSPNARLRGTFRLGAKLVD